MIVRLFTGEYRVGGEFYDSQESANEFFVVDLGKVKVRGPKNQPVISSYQL